MQGVLSDLSYAQLCSNPGAKLFGRNLVLCALFAGRHLACCSGILSTGTVLVRSRQLIAPHEF
jgi:hypothetical protein